MNKMLKYYERSYKFEDSIGFKFVKGTFSSSTEKNFPPKKKQKTEKRNMASIVDTHGFSMPMISISKFEIFNTNFQDYPFHL